MAVWLSPCMQAAGSLGTTMHAELCTGAHPTAVRHVLHLPALV